MIFKVVAQITIKQIQKVTIHKIYKCNQVEVLVYLKMQIVFLTSTKDYQMLSNVLIAYPNKAAKLILAHQVLNNLQLLLVFLKNQINTIWEAIIAIINSGQQVFTTTSILILQNIFQEMWVLTCHPNLTMEG